VSIGFIIGPILGGFLLSWMDWRSIFYCRAPVGFIAFIIAIYFLKKDHTTAEKIKIDLKGTILSSVGMALLILGLSQINKFGLKSVFVYALTGLGLISLMGFIFIERRVRDPIIDLSLFRNRHFSLAIWGLFFISTTYPAFSLTMPFYLMRCIDLTASATGLLMTVTSMAVILFSPVSGWFTDRFGPVWFSTLGAVASTTAFYFALGFGLDTTFLSVIPVMALYGFGIGIFQPPNNSIIMGGVPQNRLGTAAALVSLYRYMGLMMGTALSGTIFSLKRAVYRTALIHQGVNIGDAAKQSISSAFQDVLFVAIFTGILAVILSVAPVKLKK
ncbi:MAG: MFS transporter, partial [Deltaproteobacteria bacterium]|nr:MFS transporter [Deltaproteobacteria bacterium]